jgi:quercetin dioxygenase-like cupin family protein
VEFENEQVRVIRYHLDPGEKTPKHGHPDNVQVSLSEGTANIITLDGKTATTTWKAGEVRWRPAGQHVVENTGDKPIDGILVEMKGAGGKATGK